MNKINIEVVGDLNRFVNRCINNHIYLEDICYKDSDLLCCLIDINDFKKVKRSCYFCKIKVLNYVGFNSFKVFISNNIFKLLIGVLSFVLIDILTSYILDIEVIHTSTEIRNLVYKELDYNGLNKYKLRLSFEELDKISNNILNNNKDKLEWISISRDGMKYIVRCEERKINSVDNDSRYRDIVSSKDALITKIISSKGDVLIRSGEYVKKGDILITGKIKFNDEIKGNTRATGTVYGNVWYNVDISIPIENRIKEYTGRERYNFNLNNKIFLNNKYELFSQDNIKEINILGIKVKIYKEKEYIYNINKIDVNSSDSYVFDRIKDKFKSIGVINEQKVLKKDVNDSTIDYRVFVICNEIISKYEYYEVGDDIDTNSSN